MFIEVKYYHKIRTQTKNWALIKIAKSILDYKYRYGIYVEIGVNSDGKASFNLVTYDKDGEIEDLTNPGNL